MSVVNVKISIPGMAVEEFNSNPSPSLTDFYGSQSVADKQYGQLPTIKAAPVAHALQEAKAHCDTYLSALLVKQVSIPVPNFDALLPRLTDHCD